jgi:hypothetical protein
MQNFDEIVFLPRIWYVLLQILQTNFWKGDTFLLMNNWTIVFCQQQLIQRFDYQILTQLGPRVFSTLYLISHCGSVDRKTGLTVGMAW